MCYDVPTKIEKGRSAMFVLLDMEWIESCGGHRSLRTMMQIALSMKMIMNLCKQDRLDAWGSLRVAFTYRSSFSKTDVI